MTALSPALTPAVSDLVVRSLAGQIVSSNLDAVVKFNILGTLSGSHDTAVIILPSRGIDADGRRSNGSNALNQSLLITLLGDLRVIRSIVTSETYEFKTSNLGVNLGLVEAALVINGTVRIVLVGLHTTSLNDVLVSGRSITAVTTTINTVAVDTLRSEEAENNTHIC